ERAAHRGGVDAVARAPGAVDSRRISRYLLLLPQGVLPVVFRLARGLRGAGISAELQRGDAVSASLAEPSPLLFLPDAAGACVPLVGCAARISIRRRLGRRGGHAGTLR